MDPAPHGDARRGGGRDRFGLLLACLGVLVVYLFASQDGIVSRAGGASCPVASACPRCQCLVEPTQAPEHQPARCGDVSAVHRPCPCRPAGADGSVGVRVEVSITPGTQRNLDTDLLRRAGVHARTHRGQPAGAKRDPARAGDDRVAAAFPATSPSRGARAVVPESSLPRVADSRSRPVSWGLARRITGRAARAAPYAPRCRWRSAPDPRPACPSRRSPPLR